MSKPKLDPLAGSIGDVLADIRTVELTPCRRCAGRVEVHQDADVCVSCEREEAEQAADHARLVELVGRLELTPADQDAALQDALSKTTQSKKHVERFLSGQKPALLLFGSVGCGKTAALAHALRQYGGNASEVLHARDLAIHGADAYHLGATLVAVDDLGAERKSSAGADALAELVGHRMGMRGNKKTIFTSNLEGMREFEEFYGRRTADRVGHWALCVSSNEPTHRKQNTY